MKTHKQGDKCQTPCHQCGKIGPGTYKVRDVPISDSEQTVCILAIVCDECDRVCGFPNQSLDAVVDAVKRVNDQELRARLERADKEELEGTLTNGESLFEELESGKYDDYMNIEGSLWTEALEYFGDQEKALRWFRTPNLALGGEKPGVYCVKEFSGDLKVREILICLKHGMTDDFETKVKRALRDNPDLPEQFVRDSLAAKDEKRLPFSEAELLDELNAKNAHADLLFYHERAREQAYANVSLSGIPMTPKMKEVYERHMEGEITQEEAFKEMGIKMSYEFEISVKLPEGSVHEDFMEALEKYCSDSLCGIGIPERIGFKFEREGKDQEDAVNSALTDIKKAIPGFELLEIRS